MQARNIAQLLVSFLLAYATQATKFDPDCIGDTLKPGEKLYPDQVLGPSWNCKDGGYRFGLDSEGWLAYWTFDDAVGWYSGARGDYLTLEHNGNLVLYAKQSKGKADRAVWESGCSGKGAKFQSTGGMAFGQVVDANDKVVWKVDDDGMESVCYPGNEWPKVKCRGNILGPQVRLLRNEYVCGHSGHHRFGLNAQGKLGLWHGNRLLWAASQLADDWGDFLLLQKGGRLVLYADNGSKNVPKWQTKCKSEGAILEIADGGVSLEKRNGDTLWTIDNQGTESKCNPKPTNKAADCTSISDFGNMCQVQMIDRSNENIVTIRVNDLGKNKFEVIDNVNENCGGGDRGEAWTVPLKVRNGGKGLVDIDAGVPRLQCKNFVPNYPMEDDSQLIWLRDGTYPCNEFGEALIYFMVMEWYYFG
uniref:Bulb-type lectin domain-containing protein n=1 Tax=Pseudictyota dubia TaxID=2749911 RepID=A0A7R9WA02_9STRA|mmetsp:Transcript_38986/g.72030  ORF Transcript_38986/g.72030 Transcript_38986/m.72030 type:complete len:417 (+) Transcript_38986:46-1296(+)